MYFVNRRASFRLVAVSSVVALGVVAISVFGPRANRTVATSPRVHLAIQMVDLGGVRPSEVRDVAFLIENRGLRRLVLNEVRCGCGESVREPLLVPPGRTEEIRIGLETGVVSRTIEKTVSFATNDAAHPRIDLTVVAQVMGD